MSTNLLTKKRDELAAQLAAHDAMIADARREERAEAIEKLLALMSEHGISAADLCEPARIKPAKMRAAKNAPGVRYVFGDASYTTGRRGKPPRSYSEAKRAGVLEIYRVTEGS